MTGQDQTPIAQAWADYRNICLPPSTSPARLKDCRRAFYAGAESVMAMILRGGVGHTLTFQPLLDIEYINVLCVELTQHKRDLIDGRA